MELKFDSQKYFNLLYKGKFIEADKYRLDSIPKTLYKYISLDDNQTELNQKKFTALENNKFWLSTYKNLNDPHELKALYLNNKKLTESGYPIELLNQIMEDIRIAFLIGSFTSSGNNNTPMWAHYANNHQGVCIKYIIEEPKCFFKVFYEKQRIAIASILTNYIDNALKGNTEAYYDYSFQCIKHLPTIKGTSWKNEEEYRIIYPNLRIRRKGELQKNKLLGISIDSIFVGKNCSDTNKLYLKDISRKIGCKIYEMYICDGKEYSLSERPF